MIGRRLAAGVRIGKRPRRTSVNKQQQLPPVAQQQAPPPTEFHHQQPPSLATSMVHYLVLGFGLAFGIGLVRVAFGQAKTPHQQRAS